MSGPDHPFDFPDDVVARVSSRWFSCPGHNYSDEYKAGFIHAFTTGFSGMPQFKVCPYTEPSSHADAWWHGYGQAVTWLMFQVDDDASYQTLRVYAAMRKLLPRAVAPESPYPPRQEYLRWTVLEHCHDLTVDGSGMEVTLEIKISQLERIIRRACDWSRNHVADLDRPATGDPNDR